VSWIDALLVAAGLVLAATGRPLAGVPLVALGLVLPGLRLSARRRSGRRGVAHLVPPEVAAAYADLQAAASLEGVPDGGAVMAEADDALLEVAAVLVGRPPKGAAQHRLVRVHTEAWAATAADLRAHHESWREAVAELDALAPLPPAEADTKAEGAESAETGTAGGWLVGALLVVLAPAFLAWELGTGAVRATVALADGLALRARTAGRALVWILRAGVALFARTLRRWAELRRRVVAAAAEARGRFLAARLRARLLLRRHRRPALAGRDLHTSREE
jgi:hypothetical protein